MIDFQQISENMQNFLQENAKKTIIVCAILILMVLGAIVALCAGSQKTAKNQKNVEEQKLVLDQPLLVPSAPSVPDGYITTRKTGKKWPQKEIEKWFTLPDESEVEKLGDSNDRIINDIIGAAP